MENKTAKTAESISQKKATSPLKVLIVEDSTVQAEMYRLVFAKRRAELVFAANGLEAVQALSRENQFDLIVSDVNMPEMNGIELLTMVKRTGMAKCPVIVISTRDNLPVLEEAVKNQVATHYVVKPWNLRQMWDLIGQILPE